VQRWGEDLGVGPFQVIEHVPFDSFVLTAGGQHYDDVVFDHAEHVPVGSGPLVIHRVGALVPVAGFSGRRPRWRALSRSKRPRSA
jgi:hypothetical protein